MDVADWECYKYLDLWMESNDTNGITSTNLYHDL